MNTDQIDFDEFMDALEQAPGFELRSLYHTALKAVAFVPDDALPEKHARMWDAIKSEVDRRGGFYPPEVDS